MPTIPRFDPPANLDDFDTIADQRAAWDEFIQLNFRRNIEFVEQEVGAGQCQFYDPKVTATDPPVATDVIRWKGFPLLIAAKHPTNKKAAWQEAEQLITRGGRTFRPQDEYLEWRTIKGPSGKVVRLIFTCEGPEYWEALAEGYPRDFTRPLAQGGLGGTRHTSAAGDKQKLLALYRQLVDPAVQLADLLGTDGHYNRWNRWNTTDGIVHLSQPNNTLGAEINIAAQATILRQRGGQPVTDPPDLTENCSGFGQGGRASDPHIGDEVNTLARQGFAITLTNPVGLYIDGLPEGIDTWVTPDGQNAGTFWKAVRGAGGTTVRAVFEVPASAGYTVGDIKIAGRAIEFGGQLAEHINVQLTGIACRKGSFHNTALPCRGTSSGASAGRGLPSRGGGV
jgi:hypothetical protein